MAKPSSRIILEPYENLFNAFVVLNLQMDRWWEQERRWLRLSYYSVKSLKESIIKKTLMIKSIFIWEIWNVEYSIVFMNAFFNLGSLRDLIFHLEIQNEENL